MTKVWAYVFITTKESRKVVQSIRKAQRVVKADALFGTPHVIAILEGSDAMDQVIDKIALVQHVLGTDSKVARWIERRKFQLPNGQFRTSHSHRYVEEASYDDGSPF